VRQNMSTIDEMLRAPAEATLPPVVRWLKDRLAAGDELKVELNKPQSTLGSSTTELVLRRKEGGREQAPQSYEWDDELNAALVNLGVRSVDLKSEGERFALGLRAALRKIERRYGDGYLNAVLLDLIDESNLSKDGEIADVRKFVHTNSPEQGRTYSDCRDQIASEIGARAAEMREKLKYREEELKTIMSKALAIYLDERFSVSRRRAMGWH
jgi:hypothetical protein